MFDIFSQTPLSSPIRILALSPHTDDYELGCGGTLARLISSGADVRVMTFSTCEERVSEQWPRDILETECRNASDVMGIEASNVEIFKYPVDHFPEHRQSILETLVRERNRLKPDIVFCPGSMDVHQDHRVVYEEAVRAFKMCTILGYQGVWNCVDLIQKDVVVRLKNEYLDKKMAALAEYKSQAHRPYFKTDFLWSWARVNGVMVGVEFAEVFECIRWGV